MRCATVRNGVPSAGHHAEFFTADVTVDALLDSARASSLFSIGMILLQLEGTGDHIHRPNKLLVQGCYT
jgi:hypothetical protein